MLQVEGLGKRYGTVPVFGGVGFALARGEFVALVGESGVGKSTLLNCIAGLDGADTGRIVVDGIEVTRADEQARARLRRVQLGFVFQAFHVLPHLSVAENVALPLLLQGRPDAARVQAMLEGVGLAALGERYPAQLSGGELQRVAIARACVHRPRLILADEPTGNLDPASAARVLALLHAQVRQAGAACLLVTHSQAATLRADRVLRLTAAGVEPAPAGLQAPSATPR
ncbi:MAG TPA: ABC transporter ATP-binding protein [Rubrivivax sp.]|nr:ABC transporter ATP-binding protein [Rubrivivax sp.]